MTPEMAIEMAVDFLRRRGVLAILIGALVAGLAGFAAISLLPVEYKAVAEVRINAPKDSFPENFLQTQKSFISSPTVLNAALDLPEAKALAFVQNSIDPVSILRQRLKFESNPNSEIIDITMSGVDPREVQVLVNAVVDGYVEKAKDMKTVSLENEEKIFRQEVEQQEREIERLKRLQRSLADEVGQPDPDSIRADLDALNRELAEKRKQRDELRLKQLAAKNDLELLEKSPPQLTPEEERELRESRDKPLEEALSKLEMKADSIRANSLLGDRDPEYLRVLTYIQKQRSRTEEREAEKRGSLLERAKERQERSIESLQSNLKVMEETERLLDSQRLTLENRVSRIQKIVADIDGYKAKINELQAAVLETNKRLQDIGHNTLANNISVVHKADLPKLPSSSKKRLMAIVGGSAGSFFAVIVLFWLLDYRLKLVSRPEHLQLTMPVPVLGVLPAIPRHVKLPGDAEYSESNKDHRQWFAMLEAVNSLRITLTFSPYRRKPEGGPDRDRRLPSLLITSARDGEGKSTLSAHLAISLARSGARVVLVEADMHRPGQYDRFGVGRTPGLADALSGTLDVSEAIHETEYPGLFLLCAGSPIDDLTGILTPERLEGVFGHLRRQYDTVLIDAPPVLPVYDALLLAREAEQTLLCAMCNHSQTYAIQQALARLESVGVEVAGLVVAGVAPSTRYQYYYGGSAKGGDKRNPRPYGGAATREAARAAALAKLTPEAG